MVIRNKLIVTRGEEGRGKGVREGERPYQAAYMKDPWTKTAERIESGRWGQVGKGE